MFSYVIEKLSKEKEEEEQRDPIWEEDTEASREWLLKRYKWDSPNFPSPAFQHLQYLMRNKKPVRGLADHLSGYELEVLIASPDFKRRIDFRRPPEVEIFFLVRPSPDFLTPEEQASWPNRVPNEHSRAGLQETQHKNKRRSASSTLPPNKPGQPGRRKGRTSTTKSRRIFLQISTPKARKSGLPSTVIRTEQLLLPRRSRRLARDTEDLQYLDEKGKPQFLRTP